MSFPGGGCACPGGGFVKRANRGRQWHVPSTQVQILSFSCSFLQKIWKNNRFAHPLWELTPPLRKILDPPLMWTQDFWESDNPRGMRGERQILLFTLMLLLSRKPKEILPHPEESSGISDFFEEIRKFWPTLFNGSIGRSKGALGPSRSNIFHFHAVLSQT